LQTWPEGGFVGLMVGDFYGKSPIFAEGQEWLLAGGKWETK
jgi:hypothetical protein